MNNTIFWLSLAAYALHIMEEFFYNWRDWARNILKLPVDWTGFYITNTVVLFLGITCASIGWSNPTLALSYPALMLINAIFFHIVPTVAKKKFSPGLITACLLFIPISIIAFKQAIMNDVAIQSIGFALAEGVLIMAYPIILLKTKGLPFFNQS